MRILDAKKYFKSFICESLTSNEENKNEIAIFSSNIQNSTSLEKYLKNEAWSDDTDGKTRTYIVREPHNKKIVLYFSIKCGLVFSTDEIDDKYEKLNEDEKNLVDYLVGLLSERVEIVEDKRIKYKQIYSNYEMLEGLAYERNHRNNLYATTDDLNNIYKVDKCYSAIELQYLCRCDDFAIPVKNEFPLGFGIFWEIIVPKIIEISKSVGCEYLYLFAADHSENKDDKKLINHYKKAFMFGDLDDFDIILLKPKDNKNCLGLAQPICSLVKCRDTAWEKYSDHIISSEKMLNHDKFLYRS